MGKLLFPGLETFYFNLKNLTINSISYNKLQNKNLKSSNPCSRIYIEIAKKCGWRTYACVIIWFLLLNFSLPSASLHSFTFLQFRVRDLKISNYKRICLEFCAYYVLMYTAN